MWTKTGPMRTWLSFIHQTGLDRAGREVVGSGLPGKHMSKTADFQLHRTAALFLLSNIASMSIISFWKWVELITTHYFECGPMAASIQTTLGNLLYA